MFVQTAKIQDYAVIGDGRSAALISNRPRHLRRDRRRILHRPM